jgi:hypothetical protein
MLVKANYKDEKFNYFRDIKTNEKRVYGDIFECDDELAEERIKKGLVVKASKKEEKEYYNNLKEKKDNTQWAVSQEEDKKIHIRPVVDGNIIETPVETVIPPADEK